MANCWLWHWQAVDAQGIYSQGSWLLTDQQSIITLLVNREYTPVRYRRGKCYRPSQWQWSEKITLIRQLATLLKAGITLSYALQMLGQGHPHPGWRALLLAICQQVAQGIAFSSVLQQWPMIFPPLYPALMQVGEITGQLDECCLQLAQQQEKQKQLQKKVIKALRYPLFVLLVAVSVTLGMLLLVLPEFVTIYRTFNAPVPALTAFIMSLSSWLQRVFFPLLLLSSAAGLCWRWLHKHHAGWQRQEQRLLLRLPLFSRLWRGSLLSQIFATLTLTQQAGLTLLQGLNAAEKTITPLLWREAVIRLQQHIASGTPLHQALLHHPLFTPLCQQLIRVGEEAGALDTLLPRLAQWHESHTHELAETLAAMLEPLMMVVIGVLVGTLVIAMYLPIFNLGDVFSQG